MIIIAGTTLSSVMQTIDYAHTGTFENGVRMIGDAAWSYGSEEELVICLNYSYSYRVQIIENQ